MTGETFVELMQFSTILLGFLGLAVALRSHRRQLNAQMFLEFSSRFQRVLGSLPAETWITEGKSERDLPPATEELTKSSLQWFQLLASLYHLQSKGYLSADLWRRAQLGVKRALGSPLLKREWFTVSGAFAHYPEYCRYVHGLMNDGRRNTSKGLPELITAAKMFLARVFRLSVRQLILRANAIYLLVASVAGLIMDGLGIFLGRGPESHIVSAAPFSGVGFVEAHGLACLIAVLLLRAAPLRMWHLTGGATGVLLGICNLVFWQIFIQADILWASYLTTSLHWIFGVVQLGAAVTAGPNILLSPDRRESAKALAGSIRP